MKKIRNKKNLILTSLVIFSFLGFGISNSFDSYAEQQKETRTESSSNSWGNGDITWNGTKATFNPLKAFGFNDDKNQNSSNHKSSYYGHGSSFTTKFYNDDYTDDLWKNGSLGSLFGEDYHGRETGVSSSKFNAQHGDDGTGWGDYTFSEFGSGFNLAIFSKYLNVNGVNEGSYNDIFILTLPNYVKSISDYSFKFQLVDQLVNNNFNDNDMGIEDKDTITVSGSTEKSTQNAIEEGWGGYGGSTEYFRNNVNENVLKLQTKYGTHGTEFDNKRASGDIITYKSLEVTLTPNFYDIIIPENSPEIISNSYTISDSNVTLKFDENINWNGRDNTSSNTYDDYGMVAKVEDVTAGGGEENTTKSFVDTTSNSVTINNLKPSNEYNVTLMQYINPMNKGNSSSDDLSLYEPLKTYNFTTDPYTTSGTIKDIDINSVTSNSINFSLLSDVLSLDASTWSDPTSEWGTDGKIYITLHDDTENYSNEFIIEDFFDGTNLRTPTITPPSFSQKNWQLNFDGFMGAQDDGNEFIFSFSNLDSNHNYSIEAKIDTSSLGSNPKTLAPDSFYTNYETLESEYNVENFSQVSNNEINFDVTIPEFDNRKISDFNNTITINGYKTNVDSNGEPTGSIFGDSYNKILNEENLSIQKNNGIEENSFNISLKGIDTNTYIESIEVKSKPNESVVDPEHLLYQFDEVNTKLIIDNSSMFSSPIIDQNNTQYYVDANNNVMLNIKFSSIGSFNSTYTDKDFVYHFTINDLADNIKFTVGTDEEPQNNKTLKELSNNNEAEYNFVDDSLFVKIYSNSSVWESGFDETTQNLKIFLPIFINDGGDDQYNNTFSTPKYKYSNPFVIENLNQELDIEEEKTTISYNEEFGIIDLKITYQSLNTNLNNLFVKYNIYNPTTDSTEARTFDINGYDEQYITVDSYNNPDDTNESIVEYKISDENVPARSIISINSFGYQSINKTLGEYEWKSEYYQENSNVSDQGVYVDFDSINEENLSAVIINVTSIKDNGFNFEVSMKSEYKNEFDGEEIQIILGNKTYELYEFEYSIKEFNSSEGITYFDYSISGLKRKTDYGNFKIKIASDYTKDGFIYYDYLINSNTNIKTLSLYSNTTKILLLILIVLIVLFFIVLLIFLITSSKRSRKQKLEEIEYLKNSKYDFAIEDEDDE